MDKHYTPNGMASEIVKAIQLSKPRIVADFAAGDGALLHAVRERWKSVALVATDIDPVSVASLRLRFNGLEAEVCDFLCSEMRAACSLLNRVAGKISLAIINPPFSCRGNSKFEVFLSGKKVTCSKAMAFAINSLQYLSKRGQLIALLPSSCLTSQKDAEARAALEQTYEIRLFGGARPYDFPGCSVNVSFVAIRRKASADNVVKITSSDCTERDVSVIYRAMLFRGSVPVHELSQSEAEGVPFVHSTHLRNGTACLEAKTSIARSLIRGPAVLLPRVGRFGRDKICLYESKESIVISDCVIAILCADRGGALAIFNGLQSNFDYILNLYAGSCAPYITLARLQAALRNLGIVTEVSNPRMRAVSTALDLPVRDPAAA